VGQEPELFSGTLQENILFTHSCDEKTYHEALVVSGVAGFAQAHPHGFEMQVGERGKNISGGQKQAVALARAMVRRSKLMFLDEPTSSMDNLSEAVFVQGFKKWLSTDMTLLVATHRHSLLELVDRIIILDHGKIIADGPRAKILRQLKNPKQASAENTSGADDAKR
jgi:ATP-binding cassette subfamily C protein LapB